MTPASELIRLGSHEAVARALELLTEHWRLGHVASFSVHAEAHGVSRVSVAYLPDAQPIDWDATGPTGKVR